MADDIAVQIANAKERLEERRALLSELPRAREKLTEEAHRVQRIECRLEEVGQLIGSLESFTLSGLLESLLGRKVQKLDAYRAELSELETEFEPACAALENLEHQVQGLEQQFAEREGAEEALRSLCEQKVSLLLQRNDETSRQLSEITEQFETAEAYLRGVAKALETGKQSLKHLESLDRAARNARHNKRMSAELRGAVGGLIKDAVAAGGPKAALRYAADALGRFSRQIGELPLGDHPADIDLLRIRTVAEEFQRQLCEEFSSIHRCDEVVTLPMQEQVQIAVSHLQEMLKNTEPQVEALREQRLRFIEES